MLIAEGFGLIAGFELERHVTTIKAVDATHTLTIIVTVTKTVLSHRIFKQGIFLAHLGI